MSIPKAHLISTMLIYKPSLPDCKLPQINVHPNPMQRHLISTQTTYIGMYCKTLNQPGSFSAASAIACSVASNPVHCALQLRSRPSNSILFSLFKRHLDRIHNTLPPEDHWRAETATELWLEMTDGPNIPPVAENGSTNACHDRAGSEWRGPFGGEDTICPLLTLLCKLLMLKGGGREHRVERDAVDG